MLHCGKKKSGIQQQRNAGGISRTREEFSGKKRSVTSFTSEYSQRENRRTLPTTSTLGGQQERKAVRSPVCSKASCVMDDIRKGELPIGRSQGNVAVKDQGDEEERAGASMI